MSPARTDDTGIDVGRVSHVLASRSLTPGRRAEELLSIFRNVPGIGSPPPIAELDKHDRDLHSALAVTILRFASALENSKARVAAGNVLIACARSKPDTLSWLFQIRSGDTGSAKSSGDHGVSACDIQVLKTKAPAHNANPREAASLAILTASVVADSGCDEKVITAALNLMCSSLSALVLPIENDQSGNAPQDASWRMTGNRCRVQKRSSYAGFEGASRTLLHSDLQQDNEKRMAILRKLLTIADRALPTGKPTAKQSASSRLPRLAHAALTVAAMSFPDCPETGRQIAELGLRLAMKDPSLTPSRAFKAVSQDQVVQTLLPQIEKCLLRQKEAALAALPNVLGALSEADLSAFALKPLGNALYDATQSSNEASRRMAPAMGIALARTVRDGEAVQLKETVSKLVKSLSTAKYAYQRTSAASVLSELVASAPDATARSIAQPTLDGMVKWASGKKETGDDARAHAMGALVALTACHDRVQFETQAVESARKTIADAVRSKRSEAERRAAMHMLSRVGFPLASCVGIDSPQAATANSDTSANHHGSSSVLLEALTELASSAGKGPKAEDSLRATTCVLALLCHPTNTALRHAASCLVPESFWTTLRDADKSPLMRVCSDAKSWIPGATADLAACLARSCLHTFLLHGEAGGGFGPGVSPVTDSLSSHGVWPPNKDALGDLCKALVLLAASDRPDVSRHGLCAVRELRQKGGEAAAAKLLKSFWDAELSDSSDQDQNPRTADAGSFEPGFESDRLGRAVLACVLPSTPTELAPLAALCAHHPRLHPVDVTSMRFGQSRCWQILKASLPTPGDLHALEFTSLDDNAGDQIDQRGANQEANVTSEHIGTDGEDTAEVKDWVIPTLGYALSAAGLTSESKAVRQSAQAAVVGVLEGLNDNGRALLPQVLNQVHRFASGPAGLSPAHWTAVATVQSAIAAQAGNEEEARDRSATTSARSKSRKGGSKPSTQGGRSGKATSQAAEEKLAQARELAAETKVTLQRAASTLRCVYMMCCGIAEASSKCCPALLSLVLQNAKFEQLEDECRSALMAIARCVDARLRPKYLDIASALYRLESGQEGVQEAVAKLVHWLKDNACDPPLGAEGFALIAPFVKETMLREPATTRDPTRSAEDRSNANAQRREAMDLTRAGAQILCDHCKPDALDAAVAAAGAKAGMWALAVLEREDGAFGVAADALAFLTGTALAPRSPLLPQVLGGVLSGTSSVREASLLALERLPALAIAEAECPRDAVLGRTIWLAMHDPEDDNAVIAQDLWRQYKHPLNVSEDTPVMLALLAHAELDVRVMAARAIAESLSGDDEKLVATRNLCIPQMFTLYLKKLPVEMGGLAKAPEPDPILVPRQRAKQSASDEISDLGWHGRHGVAIALRNLCDCNALTEKDIPVVFAFLSSRGLGDLNDDVRQEMSHAGMAVVKSAGDKGPSLLLPTIEKQLEQTAKIPSDATKEAIAHSDRTRENLIMSLGAVAGFLPPDDDRKLKAAQQVMQTALETPSESVQNAAARCLAPLATVLTGGGREDEVVSSLMKKLWNETATYGERRGAAYALAGIARGLGVLALKRLKLMEEYMSAAQDKPKPIRRQGAFLGMETFAILFGRLYEPYTVVSLPVLLVCMGDSVTEVRDACWAAAQASMSEVTSQGVKMILPSLLSGLNERQWRTKAGAAEVLGAMAFCAPRQLSQCLPQVVPRLAEALADAHPKVVAAAESAISRIAAVARSPEVRNLSRFLLAALRDPAGRTQGALDAMLGTEFVHAIDPASLALLIPPLHRGLRDRSTELKKRAAAIVGSMCNNVSNPADVAPYLDLLLPDLRTTLLDAIPDVRKTSARALGALAVALGEAGLPNIISWLCATLVSGPGASSATGLSSTSSPVPANVVVVSSSAERSGAAMGLAEVSAALDDARVERILKDVLHLGRTNVSAREGGLMLLAAMPRALGERFENRLALALSFVLQGLADDSDNVREAALDAGRKTVSAYAKTSREVLLPEILSAMRDKLWRIRYAATQLLGDFLLVLAGAATIEANAAASAPLDEDDEDGDEDQGSADGEGDADEDDEADDDEIIDSPEMMAAAMSLEATMKAIEGILGHDRLNEVLAALYIVRCDVSLRVRQVGMQVWKSVVANTPRTLREIMPCAVRQVVVALSDDDEERRAAAGKALGDLSQKLGDRVVPEVLPALHSGITDSANSDRVRLGSCDGLAELVAALPKEQILLHADDLLAAVRDALCDPAAPVRASAADVFATLLKPLGSTAVDAIIPMLIEKVAAPSPTADTPASQAGDEPIAENSTDSERALDSLKQVLNACGTRLMSIVVPQLLNEVPLTLPSCKALAAAASVGKEEYEPHIGDTVAAMLETVECTESSSAILSEVLGAISSSGEDSISTLHEPMFLAFNDVNPQRRIAAARLCEAFCAGSDEDAVASSAVSLFEVLIRQLTDSDMAVVTASWEAVRAINAAVPSSALSQHVPHIRQSLRSALSGAQVGDSTATVAGLNIPKGPAPFVPIFTEALLHGTPSLREQAALAIAELVEMTDAKVLNPFVIKLTGPLIRVMSDRFAWQVKAAILRAILRLLQKAATLLRTFAPQLQSTFVKSLSDNSRLVRVRACIALGALVPVQPRVETLLNELLALGRNGATVGARVAGYSAAQVVFKGAKKLPDSAFSSMPESLLEGLDDEADEVSRAASKAFAVLASRSGSVDGLQSFFNAVLERAESEDADYVLRSRAAGALDVTFRACCMFAGLEPSHIEAPAEFVMTCMSSSASPVQSAGCAAAVSLFTLRDASEELQSVSASEQADLLAQLGLIAESSTTAIEVRVACLESLKDMFGRFSGRTPSKNEALPPFSSAGIQSALQLLAPAIVLCAADSNTGIRNAANRALRSALIKRGDGAVSKANLEYAKEDLDDDDAALLDRRLPRLLEMPDSEDEGPGAAAGDV